MERVVYILGAGFSAPLGLPVISNFLTKSKDQYARDHEKYASFSEIFSTIDRLSSMKNYFSANLFDIEEVLSILEMRSTLEGSPGGETFAKYICDVIKFHTPQLLPYHGGSMPGNWEDFIGGDEKLHTAYAYFVGNLLQVELLDSGVPGKPSTASRFSSRPFGGDELRYAVVTLNYDTVLEEVVGVLRSQFKLRTVGLTRDHANPEQAWEDGLPIAKLHGSVDSGDVVPPTWRKVVHPGIQRAWESAYVLLSEATQWRILGYSLPDGDAYMKFLLKTAAVEADRLKNIDVLCLDPTDQVRQRFSAFVDFPYFRFMNVRLEPYLDSNRKLHQKRTDADYRRLKLDRLEEAHGRFFAEA